MSASTEKKNRHVSREAGTDKKTIAQREEEAKKKSEKKKWTIGMIAAAVLIVAVLLLNSSLMYTGTAAVKVGDQSYSPAEMNYYYAQQYYNFLTQSGQYASMFGLNSQYGLSGLKAQDCGMMPGASWRDYFVDQTSNAMAQYKGLCDYAAENGIELDEEDLAALDESFAELEEAAKTNGFPSTKKFLSAYYGTGVTEKTAKDLAKTVALAAKAYQSFNDSLSYTDEEIQEKYDSYNGDRDYFDVCTYTVYAEKVTDDEGNAAVTEETMKVAREQADAILARYEELKDETDVELRLNEALAQAEVNGECTHSEKLSGASLGAYKEWAVEKRAKGDATVAENADSGYVVAAFISRDTNTYKLANVRHILIKAEADEEGNYTDEAKAAAKAEAERILEEYKSGEMTEESFAELAKQYTQDDASAENGGLYENIQKGQMVEEFDKFCFAKHKAGDTAIVYGESGSYAGYHVMYFVGNGQRCCDYIAENDLKQTAEQEWIEGLEAANPVKTKFWVRYVG